MDHSKKMMFSLGASILLLSLSGACAKVAPPLDRLEAARRAVETAETNGAISDAPLELYVARENLEEARTAMTKKEFEHARRLADSAVVQAELADAKSRNAYWTRSAAELKSELDALQAAIETESAR